MNQIIEERDTLQHASSEKDKKIYKLVSLHGYFWMCVYYIEVQCRNFRIFICTRQIRRKMYV